jgi:hypothetical protein
MKLKQSGQSRSANPIAAKSKQEKKKSFFLPAEVDEEWSLWFSLCCSAPFSLTAALGSSF